MCLSELKKNFISLFRGLSEKHNSFDVWSDFITVTAIAISNACDKRFFDERENQYLARASKYSREELENFAELFSLVVVAYEINSEQDFLGEMFSSLGLNSHWKGQFFTPYNIAKCMALINAKDKDEIDRTEGLISVSDCCCGAGCLLIAFANAMKEKGVNYQQKFLFYAQDVDPIAAMMCYIQLSIIGCRAIIKIGDSLLHPMTDNEPIDESYWLTPMHLMGNFLNFMSIFEKEPTDKATA